MAKLTLIRGLPGSGKSTYAKDCFPTSLLFEADQYFMCDGKYHWVGHLLRKAHGECYLNTLQALQLGYDVVVANTFIRLKDMQKYLNIPNVIPRVQVNIIEMLGNYTNTHNVPQEAIERMHSRWQELPTDIKVIRIY